MNLDYQMGRLGLSEYLEAQEEVLSIASDDVALGARLEMFKFAVLREGDEKRRNDRLCDFQAFVQTIVAGKSDSNFKLHARLDLLYAQAMHLTLSMVHHLGIAEMRHAIGAAQDGSDINRNISAWSVWSDTIIALLGEAEEARNISLCGDVLFTIAFFDFTRLANNVARLKAQHVDVQIPTGASDYLMETACNAVTAYEEAGNHEGVIRCKLLQAEILELLGNTSEAVRIAGDTLPIAQGMDYSRHITRARQHVTGNSPFARLIGATETDPKVDEDVVAANWTEAELEQVACWTLETLRLPRERLPVLREEVAAVQLAAGVRLGWCRFLELRQNIAHRSSPLTYYLASPERKCLCTKLGVESGLVGVTHAPTIIGAFKTSVCVGCIHRLPKNNDLGG